VIYEQIASLGTCALPAAAARLTADAHYHTLAYTLRVRALLASHHLHRKRNKGTVLFSSYF